LHCRCQTRTLRRLLSPWLLTFLGKGLIVRDEWERRGSEVVVVYVEVLY